LILPGKNGRVSADFADPAISARQKAFGFQSIKISIYKEIEVAAAGAPFASKGMGKTPPPSKRRRQPEKKEDVHVAEQRQHEHGRPDRS
jgi:hypothetical protein